MIQFTSIDFWNAHEWHGGRRGRSIKKKVCAANSDGSSGVGGSGAGCGTGGSAAAGCGGTGAGCGSAGAGNGTAGARKAATAI